LYMLFRWFKVKRNETTLPFDGALLKPFYSAIDLIKSQAAIKQHVLFCFHYLSSIAFTARPSFHLPGEKI